MKEILFVSDVLNHENNLIVTFSVRYTKPRNLWQFLFRKSETYMGTETFFTDEYGYVWRKFPSMKRCKLECEFKLNELFDQHLALESMAKNE